MAQPLVDLTDPNSFVDVRIALGRVLQLEGRVEEALKVIQAAIEPALRAGNIQRSTSVLRWAAEQATYLGMVPLAMKYTDREIELLDSREWTGNSRTRLFVAHRDRGIQLSQAAVPSEERHCDAIPELQFAADGQGEIYRQDPKSINRMIQAVTALQMLSASQALCGKREAVATAQKAIDLFNRDKQRTNWDLQWHLAFAQLRLGQVKEASATLAQVTQPDAAILELQAECALAQRQPAQARQLLAAARKIRAPQLNSKSFERNLYFYQQAQNMALALRAGDSTQGLREEALKLLDVFPKTEVARSIIRLRNELRP
jgi:hypothetical protein